MSAEAFVKLAHSYGLINAARMEKVLQQIATASKPVSAEKIASALVKKDLITGDEAQRLLATLKNPPTAQFPGPPELEPLEAELEVIEDDPTPSGPPVAELDEGAVFKGSPRAASIPSDMSNDATETIADEKRLNEADIDDIHSPVSVGTKLRKSKGLLAKLGLGGKPGKRTNQWDSPLMLVGGGALLLMLIGGAGLGWYLTRETGEQVFATAEEDYRAQKYTSAISKYQRFLDKFPSHPDASTARVRVSMSRIRQAVESRNDWERALDTTARELLIIKSESTFHTEARPDLSGLLPAIYAGFIESAEKARETVQKQHLLDQSAEALELIDNPEYLPGSLRKNVQLDIERTSERAALIVREINRDKELNAAIEKIKQAAASKDTTAAYATRNDLLSRYPGLATNADLITAVQGITSAERARVTVSNQGLTAVLTDHPTTIANKVALADRKTQRKTGITDRSIYAFASGALYGLNADNGEVRWRRWLGYANSVSPMPISNEPRADALAFDDERQELLRLSSGTGKLVWRLPFGEPIAEPILTDEGLAIATASGKLALVDPNTGRAAPVAQLPQKLTTGPGVDPRNGCLYQVGRHSSLYVLAADTMECRNVAYVGHRPSSVKVPAVAIAGHVVVAENGGDFCWLHVLVGDANGDNLRPAMQKIRLEGEIHVPMQRFGRRLLVVTDLGALHVYNIDPSAVGQPAREIAKTLPSNRTKGTTYTHIDSGRVFVADNKLARFELQAARGELVRKWVQNSDDIYVSPPRLYGNVLFTVRRNSGSSSTTISAIRVAVGRSQEGEGDTYWTTEVAARPSAGADYDARRASIAVVSRDGDIWDVSGRHLKSGVNDQASTNAVGISDHKPTATRDGRVIFSPSFSGENLIIVDPTAKKRLRSVTLPLSKPQTTTRPVSMGDDLLVCSAAGTIHAVDNDGEESLLPFQPGLTSENLVQWLTLAVVDEAKRAFVAATVDGDIFVIAPQVTPIAHLAAQVTRHLNTELTGDVTAIGNQIVAVTRSRDTDEIRVLKLEDLSDIATTTVQGRVIWGPKAISSDMVLISTNDNQLHAINSNGRIVWTSPLPFGALAGDPLATARELILTSVNGQVWRIHREDGKPRPWAASRTHLDVGEPLGARAVIFSKKLLLLGRDSTLFVTELPQSAATASR